MLLSREPNDTPISARSVQAIDRHIGSRLRARRDALGLTQTALADALGISFQQVQKYEAGRDRISAGRLFAAARVLDVPISWFFEEFQGGF